MGKKDKKDEKKQYTPKQLAVLAKFGMGPDIDVSKEDAAVLDVISQLEDTTFYDLCDCFDTKPSRMDKKLLELEAMGLLEYPDDDITLTLTDLAERYLAGKGKDSKAEKKFRKFLECLNEEELDRFVELADKFQIDETLLPAADPEEEAEAAEEAEAPEEEAPQE
ncbi:MAG: hypothetical protein IKI65_04705 [Firmicutes bacterium]|nr:hypothetical protein [Bacillota bacterium]